MWDFLWTWLVCVISSELCKFDSTCSFFFVIVEKVLGSCWYLLSILRQEECWMKVCSLEQEDCKYWFLYCSDANNPIRAAWFKSSNISSLCDGTSDFFQFGIYGEAVTSGTTASRFFNKYYFCVWWGLRNLR